MNAPIDRNLDRLLRDWAKTHSPDERQLEALGRQILEAPRDGVGRLTATGPLRKQRWPRLVLAVAASAVIAVGLLFGLRHSRQVARDDILKQGMAADDLADAALLFTAAHEQFDDRLAWLVDTDQRLHIGLREVPSTSAVRGEPARRVVVRLVAVARSNRDQAWRELWSIDVIADDEEFVEISAPTGRSGRVLVWPYVLDDGNIAVDTEIDWDGPIRIRSAQSAVYRPSVPSTIVSAESGESELRIISTAALLPEDLG